MFLPQCSAGSGSRPELRFMGVRRLLLLFLESWAPLMGTEEDVCVCVGGGGWGWGGSGPG